jgi:hypothetical protein
MQTKPKPLLFVIVTAGLMALAVFSLLPMWTR